jgi:hypothetical protein
LEVWQIEPAYAAGTCSRHGSFAGSNAPGECPPSSHEEDLGPRCGPRRIGCERRPEVALDLIFGPAMYWMAIGHGGLTPADADAIVATAMRALAS